MRVLIGCEYSGTVRDAFIRGGAEAMSCDILPTEAPGPHYEGDIFDVIDYPWDLAIFHPPCTHLATSGAAWFKDKRMDGRQQSAVSFFMSLVRRSAHIPMVAIENPVCIMSSLWEKPAQLIQPWQFGDEAQKSTCLWLKGLPKLVHTNIVGKGEFYTSPSGKLMPAWSHDMVVDGKKVGWNTPEIKKLRSKTFQGIADAMASQWGVQ